MMNTFYGEISVKSRFTADKQVLFSANDDTVAIDRIPTGGSESKTEPIRH